MSAIEANFDGLIGPTHNYAGLSHGNIASADHALEVANPKEAALQGLGKMRRLAEMGFVQGLLPPHARPHTPTLKRLGFSGSDHQMIVQAARHPEVLRNVYAAAAMWTANAATISPSADTKDGRLHITPANLTTMFHRSIEPPTTSRMLKAIFPDEKLFAHHEPLPAGAQFGDEGAANHSRFCSRYGDPGVELFVYGRQGLGGGKAPKVFPGRQALEASQAIAHLHRLDPARTLYVQQNPAAIDAGAFHNDVVAVANRNVFFYHEEAFEDPDELEVALRRAGAGFDFAFVRVPSNQVPAADAVGSYLFNSQLLDRPGSGGHEMMLILPEEAREIDSTRAYLEELTAGSGPITRAEFLDLRQSMRNGGGPACLRLRVVLSEPELSAVHKGVLPDEAQFERLEDWVKTHYRDRLLPDDLADPSLMGESYRALDELTEILGLGSLYHFQR
ncbi:MAG: N-succinylarginine dihydrolase [Proteobacteria bacterium]|nr:N-succinylarginine dihydrolase [Pseudomonadota bacterium]